MFRIFTSILHFNNNKIVYNTSIIKVYLCLTFLQKWELKGCAPNSWHKLGSWRSLRSTPNLLPPNQDIFDWYKNDKYKKRDIKKRFKCRKIKYYFTIFIITFITSVTTSYEDDLYFWLSHRLTIPQNYYNYLILLQYFRIPWKPYYNVIILPHKFHLPIKFHYKIFILTLLLHVYTQICSRFMTKALIHGFKRFFA